MSSDEESFSDNNEDGENGIHKYNGVKYKENDLSNTNDFTENSQQMELSEKYSLSENEKLPEDITLDPLPTDITCNDKIELCGKVLSTNYSRLGVVVEAMPPHCDSSEKAIAVLDHDSVLCTINYEPIGRVEEVFGPIIRPFYLVRLMGKFAIDENRPTVENLESNDTNRNVSMKIPKILDKESEKNDEKHVQNDSHSTPESFCGDPECAAECSPIDPVDVSKALCPGTKIFVLKKYGNHVITSRLDFEGSDASNIHDEEVSEGERDYSDDEAEMNARMSKNRKRKTNSQCGIKNTSDLNWLNQNQRKGKRSNKQPRQQNQFAQPFMTPNYQRTHGNQVGCYFDTTRSNGSMYAPMPVHIPLVSNNASKNNPVVHPTVNRMQHLPQYLHYVPYAIHPNYLPPLNMVRPNNFPYLVQNKQQSDSSHDNKNMLPLYYQYWHATKE